MNDTPTRSFALVPADLITLVSDGKLSKEAAWLYVVLLSHHNRSRRDDDVWPSRSVMAQKLGLKKPQSVDKYLEELRTAGLIVSERRKRSSDMNTSSKHTLLLTVPRTAEEIAARRASREAIPHSGQRYPLQRTSDVPHSGQELDEVELDELKDVEAISPTAARFAHDGGRHENSKDQKTDEDWPDPWAAVTANGQPINPPLPHQRATYENWHDADRQIFREHVGEVLVSVGKKGSWKKGEWSANAFYNAFRRRQEGEKRWPGKYVETLSYAGDSAVDDWLIDQGLERPEWQ